MKRGAWTALWLALCWTVPLDVSASARHVSIIVDTSGSMDNSDRPRYTLLLSEILADLLDAGDSLTVIRLPPHQRSCGDAANAALAVQMNPADRGGFQTRLDKLLDYDTGNHFAAPVHTAQADLAQYKDKARLLLFIADSGGLGDCDRELTEDLQALRDQGVTIAAINMGGPGAFDTNAAFAFTTGALDSEALARSVAEVYQKFIGAKEVQTGRAGDAIEIELDPFVKDAYLVVVADGRLNALEEAAANPGAERIDLNYKGGGRALGLDGRTRDYGIVHLRRPKAGRWRFLAPSLKNTAGWMLLQDSALALRLLSPPEAAQDMTTPLEAEVYDQDTGKRLENPSEAGLQASVEIEGRTLTLRDDGQDGDRIAGDGVFTTPAQFSQVGAQRIRLNLQSKLLDRHVDVDIQVEKVGWVLQAHAPQRVEMDTPASLAVQSQANPTSLSPVPLQLIEVYIDGKIQATLRDDGQNGDKQAGDNRYTGAWTPEKIGDYTIEFKPVGGGKARPVPAQVKVVGSVRFGKPIPVELGRTGSNSELQGRLDSGADTIVKGEVSLSLSTTYTASGSVLEIDLGHGWTALDSHPRPLLLTTSGPRGWPLRLRVGDCPSGVDSAERFIIEFTGADADGQPLRHGIPLRLEIVEDPWLHCWWPVLLAISAVLLTGVIIHGYWSPSRFPRKLGVVLSPEQDMNEGFFHPIHAQRGAGSGFYRDARVYIRQDFRLSSSAKGALARLRADGKQVYVRPESGISVYRQSFDGEWDVLPTDESPVHFGVVYKDSMGALYFEIRNG